MKPPVEKIADEIIAADVGRTALFPRLDKKKDEEPTASIHIEPTPDRTAPTPVSTASGKPAEVGWRGAVPFWLIAVPLLAAVLLGLAVGLEFLGDFPEESTPMPTQVAVVPTVNATPTIVRPTVSPVATPTPTPSPQPTPSATPTAAVSTPLAGAITGACMQVVHSPLGEFISYLDWTMVWAGLDVDRFEVTIQGANNDAPQTLVYDPAAGGWRAQIGLLSAGPKRFVSLTAVLADGTAIDLTEALTSYFRFEEFDVRFPQEDSFGGCPAN